MGQGLWEGVQKGEGGMGQGSWLDYERLRGKRGTPKSSTLPGAGTESCSLLAPSAQNWTWTRC